MRCRDARAWLDAQRDRDLDEPQAPVVQKHLQECDACRNAAHSNQHRPEDVFVVPTPLVRASISTDRIMHAIQQQRHVTQQLEELRLRQHTRVERIRPAAASIIALSLFVLSSIPLFCFIMLLIQTDLVARLISLLSGVLDVCIIVGQYLQEELTLLAHNNLLLSGLAFAVVVMMGMWLRLMRPPREA